MKPKLTPLPSNGTLPTKPADHSVEDRLNTHPSQRKRTRLTLRAIRQQVATRIREDDDFVQSALLHLYLRQTAVEQDRETTIDHNGEGFDTVDAKILTPLGARLVSGGTLSARDLAICREKRGKSARLARYWRQLAELLEHGGLSGTEAVPNRRPLQIDVIGEAEKEAA
jgi:hypothetical protein